MIPNADLIERWSTRSGDYVMIPATAWPELIWVLRQAEQAEDVVHAAKDLSDAHDRHHEDYAGWTLSEKEALTRIRQGLSRMGSSRSFAA